MGSMDNPWSPYETYKDCSQGICSLYCPQWCYIIFPPPPPFGLEDAGDHPSLQFSPLIVAVIGILASAFVLVCYYTVISKYCRRRSHSDAAMELRENRDLVANESSQASSRGLDEALIKSIKVCKYKKGEGLVEGTDCSVCLSEFQENESLRLLPKCNHAFHLPCIDTWLKSQSSCPLCRSNISLPPQISPVHVQETPPQISALQHQQGNIDAVLEVRESEEEAVVISMESHDVVPKASERRDNTVEIRQEGSVEPFRRSLSMNHSVCQGHDGECRMEILDIGFQENGCNGNNRDGVKSNSPGMKRSISTGGFMFTRYDGKGNNSVNPI